MTVLFSCLVTARWSKAVPQRRVHLSESLYPPPKEKRQESCHFITWVFLVTSGPRWKTVVISFMVLHWV